jgi:hypothetical protein
MNWLHFFIWLTGLYLLYYLVVVGCDSALRRKTSAGTAANELTFSEDIAPQSIEHLPDKTEPPKPRPQPSMIGSGGVSLKNLFGLAREEAIIYTKAVSF